ncbi:MAG: hypothetical protein IT292_10625 [Deltaproteobacteria bacterium]|nr:hypothetical protein [Deltaproteobacteria bacterium]
MSDEDNIPTKTELAQQVSALKARVDSVIEKRQQLPHPLFWSLFHSEIDKIRTERKAKQFERRFLFGIDW